MGRILNFIKAIFAHKPKRPLTPAEKQAIDEQIIMIDTIARNN